MANGAALLSLGAAAIHFAVSGEHFREDWIFGVAFIAMGVAQTAWAMAVRERPSRRVVGAGALLSLLLVALWAISRTVGLPFGPHPLVPEPVGLPDVTASVFEGLVALLCVPLLRRLMDTLRVPARGATAGMVVLALMVVPLAAAALVAGAPAETPVAMSAGREPQAPSRGERGSHERPVRSTHRVKVLDNRFAPRKLEVAPGDTVEWIYAGSTLHTVTAETGDFDSGDLSPNDSFSQTFDEEGAYLYYCRFHGAPGKIGMRGVVLVVDAGQKEVPPRTGGTPPSKPPASAAPDPQSKQVTIRDDSFGPQSSSVPVGSSVRWINRGRSSHTVTSDSGKFNSASLSPGRSFELTFARAGDYFYHCEFHGGPRSGMWGVIHVRTGGGGAGDGGAGDDHGGPGGGGEDDHSGPGGEGDGDNSGSGRG
jgi:plastocyanin